MLVFNHTTSLLSIFDLTDKALFPDWTIAVGSVMQVIEVGCKIVVGRAAGMVKRVRSGKGGIGRD
jgi:hypothetical protein